MAKGDDALARKKNRAQRKKARSMTTKSSVSARIASIIAAKRRRKTGKRRVCEAMCFTLPTPEDPFNDRNDPMTKKERLLQKSESSTGGNEGPALGRGNSMISKNFDFPASSVPSSEVNGKPKGGADADSDDRVSKYLVLCLKAIQESSDVKRGSALVACKWGIEFWRSLSSGLDVMDSSGDCASPEQIAWLAAVASDIIARREKEGLLVPCPFLVFLVPSQDRASEVRLFCKPLKALGVHSVSLHPGASLDHQVRGLKSCEPEFIISTPDRIVSLISTTALNMSSVSLLVLDGLGSLIASGYADEIKLIREHISGDPRTVSFGNERGGRSSGPLLLNLMKQPAHKLPPLSLDCS